MTLPPDQAPPLRIAVFGESIVSDWGNPAATTWRALLRALTAAGHEALFLERRRNRATVELLRARGAEPLRAFANRYPDLRYRTYDLPHGLERSVWFGREVATLDAAIVLDTAPPEIVEELRAYRTPRLVRLLHQTGSTVDADVAADFDVVLTPTDGSVPGDMAVGPAVETPAAQLVASRAGVLVVAYDDPARAGAAADALAGLAPRLVTAGDLGEPWAFVPEVELPDRYRTAEVAVVVTEERSPLAAARLALPLAAGCPVVAVRGHDRSPLHPIVPTATSEDVATQVERIRAAPGSPMVPDHLRAEVIATRLVERIRSERAARR